MTDLAITYVQNSGLSPTLAGIPAPVQSLALARATVSLAQAWSPFTQPGMALGSDRRPMFDGQYHNRVHVIPRRRDMGFVLSAQTVPVEVWNAWLERASINTAVSITGPPGVVLAAPPATPQHYASSQSRIFQIQVQAQGGAEFINVITFTFTGQDASGTNITLTGKRAIPFPFDPNMADKITERYGFATDVLAAENDHEQRIQLKEVPVRGIAFRVLATSEREASYLESILHGWQDKTFGIPMWWDTQPLNADVALGGTVINVTTTNRDYEVGGLVILWQDPFTWELLTVLSFNASSVTLTTGTTRAWTVLAGTKVIPVRLGRLDQVLEVARLNSTIGEADFDFSIDAFRVS